MREQAGDCVSLLAGSAAVNFPFVEAKLARKQPTEKGDAFLPAQIPAAVVECFEPGGKVTSTVFIPLRRNSYSARRVIVQYLSSSASRAARAPRLRFFECDVFGLLVVPESEEFRVAQMVGRR